MSSSSSNNITLSSSLPTAAVLIPAADAEEAAEAALPDEALRETLCRRVRVCGVVL